MLRDESSIKHSRLLLTHPMASPTDVRLISQIELIAQKSEWNIFLASVSCFGNSMFYVSLVIACSYFDFYSVAAAAIYSPDLRNAVSARRAGEP